MREKLIRFMYGRYGIDSLGKFTVTLAIILIFLSRFTHFRILALLSWALIILSYFRMLSRNIYKRAAENQAYLNRTSRFRLWFGKQKNIFMQRKTHHIYTCPSCRQKIRIPRGKGKVEIRCPKCGTTFIKRS